VRIKTEPNGHFLYCRAPIAFSGIARRIGQVQEPTMQQRQIKSAAVPHLQELTGRTAIVTGSTSGIGLGIAQAFAASGMHVMLNVFGDEKETRTLTRWSLKHQAPSSRPGLSGTASQRWSLVAHL